MKHCKILALAAVGAFAAGAAGGALAYQAGDLILRAGIASVQPNEDSDALSLDGTRLPGTGAGLNSSEQLGLTLTYMFTPQWGVGVLAATPFEHDIKAKGVGVDAGSAKHLPPTVTLQYFPLGATSRWQPYVGLGVNYTLFFDEQVDGQLEEMFGPGDLDLDNSWGWAGQAGLDYQIDDHWLVNAAVWYLDIDTDATFKFAANRITTDVNVDPWVYMLGVGYRF
ncbi:MAG: outer membrane beta-barrel protein [Gammaproteobacteria bacterium]|nr:outer membrane beta-barrel protein [Gammaproteobacteria bacterium]MBK9428157.1 outer membrane beta-barrel protein [Gammaproteobacteria bacterium]